MNPIKIFLALALLLFVFAITQNIDTLLPTFTAASRDLITIALLGLSIGGLIVAVVK